MNPYDFVVVPDGYQFVVALAVEGGQPFWQIGGTERRSAGECEQLILNADRCEPLREMAEMVARARART